MPRDITTEDDPSTFLAYSIELYNTTLTRSLLQAVHPVPFLATEEDEAPATIPESTGEQSRIKTILGLLKK